MSLWKNGIHDANADAIINTARLPFWTMFLEAEESSSHNAVAVCIWKSFDDYSCFLEEIYSRSSMTQTSGGARFNSISPVADAGEIWKDIHVGYGSCSEAVCVLH
jgi:hypothetical protein